MDEEARDRREALLRDLVPAIGTPDARQGAELLVEQARVKAPVHVVTRVASTWQCWRRSRRSRVAEMATFPRERRDVSRRFRDVSQVGGASDLSPAAVSFPASFTA
jgi:hypothetical protein